MMIIYYIYLLPNIETMTKFLISFLLLSTLLSAQNKKHILLKNAVAHIGNGEVIENSLISIKDGKIDLVADARLIKIDISRFDTTIDLFGKHIYPGLNSPTSA